MNDLDSKRSGTPSVRTSGKPGIVLIDDDPQVLKALRVVLRPLYDVVPCDTGVSGVEAVQRTRPQAVILDIKMPDKDGFWVFSEIRKFDRQVPILFNSAYQDKLDLPDVVASYRPFAYLSKAGGITDFLAKVREAVTWYQSQTNVTK